MSLRAQAGSVRRDYGIDFRNPWIFDRPVSFGFGLFRQERDYDEYDEDHIGGYTELGRRWMRDLQTTLRYQNDQVDITNISDLAPSAIRDDAGKNRKSSFSGEIVLDKRNSIYMPTRGFRSSLSYEYAGDFLGGTRSFSKAIAAASVYRNLWEPAPSCNVVLSAGCRAGWAEAHSGSSDVPVFERFFAGGMSTIRGFESRQAGPQENGESVGGDILGIATADLELPIMENTLKGAVFYDYGNVWRNRHEINSQEMRSSWGVEMRIRIPALGPVPIRFGYAFPLEKEPGDESQKFYFSMGGQF